MKSMARSAAAITATVTIFLTSSFASAETPATRSATPCTEASDRAKGLKLQPGQKSWADLSITIAENQRSNLSVRTLELLEGPCAQHVHAFMMSQIAFDDGAVFSAKLDRDFVYLPNRNGLSSAWAGPPRPAHPEIDKSTFVMATKVDGAFSKRSLNVGVWQTDDGYLVAAFIHEEGVFSELVELMRSKYPIRSVSFFPSPDSNSGTLGVTGEIGGNVALINMDWNHAAMSRVLRK